MMLLLAKYNKTVHKSFNRLNFVVFHTAGGVTSKTENKTEYIILSICMKNKNLAIANRSRVSCINTNNNTMTLKSGLEVTQRH